MSSGYVPGGLRAAAAGRHPQSGAGAGGVGMSGGGGGGGGGGGTLGGAVVGVGATFNMGGNNERMDDYNNGNNNDAGSAVSVAVRGDGSGEYNNNTNNGRGVRGGGGGRHPLMLDDGGGGARGDYVTRVWQPTPAPDAVSVDALMLGPPTPTQQSGGAASSRVSKDAPERQARMEEDDGLVVRQRPKARADNNARRKQRANHEPNPAQWFDPEDGGLRCLADPVPPGGERTRPARWFDPEAPYLQTAPATDTAASDDAVVAMANGGGMSHVRVGAGGAGGAGGVGGGVIHHPSSIHLSSIHSSPPPSPPQLYYAAAAGRLHSSVVFVSSLEKHQRRLLILCVVLCTT